MYVWRFADSRYQLKMVFFFWNKRALAEIEAARRDYYSSYQISSEKVSRVNKHRSNTMLMSNKIHCEIQTDAVKFSC
jgi:hypothetical protein